MLRHSLRRLLGLIPTLLMLITVAFFMMRVAPGGPFDSEKSLPPEIEANLNAKYHLDDPLLKQYFHYLGQVAVLDFGPSFQYKDWTVNELIAQGFPVSMTVGVLAMSLAFIVAMSVNVSSAEPFPNTKAALYATRRCSAVPCNCIPCPIPAAVNSGP